MQHVAQAERTRHSNAEGLQRLVAVLAAQGGSARRRRLLLRLPVAQPLSILPLSLYIISLYIYIYICIYIRIHLIIYNIAAHETHSMSTNREPIL